MFGGMGMTEMILIFLVVLLVFGAKRLPEIGSSLGKGIREFKGSLREIESELKVDDTEPRDRQVRRPADDEDAQSAPRRLTSSEGRADADPSATPRSEPEAASRPEPAGRKEEAD